MYKPFIFYTLLMLCIPICAWLLGYQWQPSDLIEHIELDTLLMYVSETGTMPYALITTILLSLILILIKPNTFKTQQIILICAFSMFATQTIKSSMKWVFQEPRPFVQTLVQHQAIAHSHTFYQFPLAQQVQITLNHGLPSPAYDRFAAHQADELGYAFPSGHTIFAVSWLLLFVFFLSQPNRLSPPIKRLILTIITLWAALVLISRMRLGMHYPIDLFVSTLIASVLHGLLFTHLLPKRTHHDPFFPC